MTSVFCRCHADVLVCLTVVSNLRPLSQQTTGNMTYSNEVCVRSSFGHEVHRPLKKTNDVMPRQSKWTLAHAFIDRSTPARSEMYYQKKISSLILENACAKRRRFDKTDNTTTHDRQTTTTKNNSILRTYKIRMKTTGEQYTELKKWMAAGR